MKSLLLALSVSASMIISTSAMALGDGEGHVVHCSYEGTNSPNRSWSTRTADNDDTLHATNLCLAQGGNVYIDRPYLNPMNA